MSNMVNLCLLLKVLLKDHKKHKSWGRFILGTSYFTTSSQLKYMISLALHCKLLRVFCCNPSFGFATKAKGLQGYGPRGRKPGNQGKDIARLRAKRKPGSDITYSRECKKVRRSVREWTFTLLRQLPLWEMESRWTPETSESDLRGQNNMTCGVLYIIRKLLKPRCLKWVRITHSDIWNISYGQKKGQDSNCQFDPRPEKVEINPIHLSADNVQHTVGKLSTRTTTLL